MALRRCVRLDLGGRSAAGRDGRTSGAGSGSGSSSCPTVAGVVGAGPGSGGGAVSSKIDGFMYAQAPAAASATPNSVRTTTPAPPRFFGGTMAMGGDVATAVGARPSGAGATAVEPNTGGA